MLSVQSARGCWLTFEKLLRAELRGGLPAKLLWGEAVRAAGQITAGRGWLRAMMWQNLRCGLTAGQVTAGRGGLRAMMWHNLRCGLTAGQVTAGRAAGSDFQPAQGLSAHTNRICGNFVNNVIIFSLIYVRVMNIIGLQTRSPSSRLVRLGVLHLTLVCDYILLLLCGN